MSKTFRFIAIILALATCSSFAVACNNSESSGNSESLSPNLVDYYDGGLHEINYSKTNDYFIKDNKSDYVVLVPDGYSDEIKFCSGDMRQLIREATKYNLPLYTDAEIGEYSENKKVISLGNTTYAESAEVFPTEELDRYGYAIKTVGKNIYIVANSDVGVTFGVYGFLELQFNFDCFSDRYYIIDKVSDSNLLNFDIRDAGDFRLLQKSTQFQGGSAMRRMRCMLREEFTTGASNSGHATLRILPPTTYYEAHPSWYSDDVQQLCYTAHGNEEEYEALMQELFNKFISCFIKESKEKFILDMGQMDKSVWCSCDACSAAYRKYGSNCVVQIWFNNELAKRIEDWMESDAGKPYARDFEIRYWIYHKTIEAPVKLDANGKYVPIDDSVIPANHTMPILAPLDMDFLCDIDSDCNKQWMLRLDKWSAILGGDVEAGVFSYFRNYENNFLYYDSYTNMQNWYRYLARFNVHFFYDEGAPASATAPNWTALKGYLITKLSWNVNLDIEDLTRKFFENYFGEAGEDLYEVFNESRGLAGKTRPELCDNRGKFDDYAARPDITFLYPEAMALDALKKFDDGLKKIEYLKKVDPDLYDTFYRNITTERFAYEYILIEFYGGRYDPDELLTLKLQAKNDAKYNSIGGINSDTSINVLWSKWGV